MFPRTRRPLAVGILLGVLSASAACGTPPQPAPTGPPEPRISGALPATGLAPSVNSLPPFSTSQVTPGLGTPPPFTGMPTTTPPVTATSPSPRPSPSRSPSPSPTPSHAARCAGEPTGTQVVALAKQQPAVPDTDLAVAEGPYCSGEWSFTTIGMTGAEPLSVVTTGKGTTLALVTAGTDVCNPRVKAEAPPGIRVLACGY